jgi:uncharacterized phage-associated protein
MKNDRLANVVLYLLRGAPKPGLVKLLKLIYFADFLHYRTHLVSLTGAKYVALTRGPVLDRYEDEFASLEQRGFICVKDVPVVGHEKPKQEYMPIGEPNESAFSAPERATLDEVLLRYGNKSGYELSEMTHEELAPWKLVYDQKVQGKPIPYTLFRWLENYADDRDVAMAKERAGRPEVVKALAEADARINKAS